jgi:putative nucleotidyltransferase with HDIG domain
MSGPAEPDFAGRLDDLPSPPGVVMELLSTLEQEDSDVASLARKVSMDQALTAKTLRLVNSSMYSLSAKVATIQQAIIYLGFQTTRNLITAAGLTGCFPNRQCSGFDHQAFWRHSLAVAACARVLARHLRINQDIAFTAGLLHDLGRLVLVTLQPERYAQVIAQRKAHDGTLLAAEREVLATDHMLAGAALARHWNFSGTMLHALAFHHAPETAGAGALATLIHVADAVVHALDLAGDEHELVPPLSQAAWSAVGIGDREWLQVFREAELQYEEMATILTA